MVDLIIFVYLFIVYLFIVYRRRFLVYLFIYLSRYLNHETVKGPFRSLSQAAACYYQKLTTQR